MYMNSKYDTLYIEGEFWENKQRNSNPINEVPYRACFKPNLVQYFIENYSTKGDIVYDPFAGRGTVPVTAALYKRIPIYNDINPLCKILTHPRLMYPNKDEISKTICELELYNTDDYSNDDMYSNLLVFYHKNTLNQLYHLKSILHENTGNSVYDWIRMIATTRLSGHSSGYFSVYTLPPNQACTIDSQRKINNKLQQSPEEKDVKSLILKKSNSMLKQELPNIKPYLELCCDAACTSDIPDSCIQLTVTSPPFLNTVDYKTDNWLRCWFNDIDINNISFTNTPNLNDWIVKMKDVFTELYRITKLNGYVAFEVGEVNNGKINLDEYIVDIASETNFKVQNILINNQFFTKTSNIWGISNNKKGTNTNRIVVCKKI